MWRPLYCCNSPIKLYFTDALTSWFVIFFFTTLRTLHYLWMEGGLKLLSPKRHADCIHNPSWLFSFSGIAFIQHASKLCRMEFSADFIEKLYQLNSFFLFRLDLSANYIHMKTKTEGVYQYSVHFHPTLDSKGMRFKIINSMQDIIGPVKAFDGAILFLPIRLSEKVRSLHRWIKQKFFWAFMCTINTSM